MLDTFFYTMVNMSITASLIGIIVILLRHVKIIPRELTYLCWCIVYIRLILPFAPSCGLSIFNYSGRLVKQVVDVASLPREDLKLTMTNSIGAARTYFPVSYKTGILQRLFGSAAIIWIIVAIILMAIIYILYINNSKELQKSFHKDGDLYTSNLIDSPLVFGFINQRIIIPGTLEDKADQLKFILLHEKAHMKRHDNIWKLLAITITCLYWFNPLLWICLWVFLNDMELTCDRIAVKGFTDSQRKYYAKLLVNYSAGREVFMMTAFSRSKVKTRVANILDYKKATFLILAFSSVFFIALAVSLLTNPLK